MFSPLSDKKFDLYANIILSVLGAVIVGAIALMVVICVSVLSR